MRRKTVKERIIRPFLVDKQRSFLESMLSPQRIETIRTVLNRRLGDIVLVLDNLFDPHNIGATLRTCEALGIQDIHIIERDNNKPELSSKVTKYSDKWITIHIYHSAADCLINLREKGFRILAAQMAKNACSIYDVPVSRDSKIAIVVGNEHDGVSNNCLHLADQQIIVPMHGFTESFNVSVATALILGSLVQKKRAALLPETGSLPSSRKDALYDQWLQLAVKQSERLLDALENQAE